MFGGYISIFFEITYNQVWAFCKSEQTMITFPTGLIPIFCICLKSINLQCISTYSNNHSKNTLIELLALWWHFCSLFRCAPLGEPKWTPHICLANDFETKHAVLTIVISLTQTKWDCFVFFYCMDLRNYVSYHCVS